MWIENQEESMIVKLDSASMISIEECYEEYETLKIKYGVYINSLKLKEFETKEEAEILYNKLKSMLPEVVQI